jgi:hypothetical protein
MIELKDFKIGGKYPPLQETSRIGKVASNRKLYNNDLRPHLVLKEGENSVRINLFRKAIDIYTNFLLSEGVDIDFGSETANNEFSKRAQHLLDVLYLVNTDSKRYGVGVLTIDQDTGLFKVYEPDQWYQIRSTSGSLTAEVLVEYLDNPIEVPKEQKNTSYNYAIIKIIINDYLTNKQTITAHKLKGGQIGEVVSKSTVTSIVGRQIVPLFSGYAQGQEGISVFDDIKDTVIDMVRIKQNLSRTLERNSSPHLAAPSGILVENEQGNIDINTQGMLFPMEKDDAKPFYLQWDTDAVAAQFQMEEHWKAYFSLTSIPRMVFDPSVGGYHSSGESLKRMLFPFMSSLAKLREANKSLIRQALVIYNNYLLTNGLKQLTTTEPEIDIPYINIFIDTMADLPREPEQKEVKDERTD